MWKEHAGRRPCTRGYKLVELRLRLRTGCEPCSPIYWDGEMCLTVLEILRLGMARVYERPEFLRLNDDQTA